MIQEIKRIIEAAIPDAEVIVSDPNNDGEHFQAVVISASFEGLSLVKQHQMVMNSLKEEFKEKVHALALKTMTPDKFSSPKK